MEDVFQFVTFLNRNFANVSSVPVIHGEDVVRARALEALAHKDVVAGRVHSLVQLVVFLCQEDVADRLEAAVEEQQIIASADAGDVLLIFGVVCDGGDAGIGSALAFGHTSKRFIERDGLGLYDFQRFRIDG